MMPSNRMQSHQTMKLIMNTYPGFQELPKGVRKLLLVSESFFFDEMQSQTKRPVVASAGLVSPSVPIPKEWPQSSLISTPLPNPLRVR